MPEASVAVSEPAASAEPTLRLRGVGRRFGGLHAVRDVDLDVLPGERRGILGPNGAGKTTLFNVISGDLPPSSGTVELFVEDAIYLSILGVGAGHLRPVILPRKDGEIRDRSRAAARRAAIDHKLPERV